jgi:hypothetical protein
MQLSPADAANEFARRACEDVVIRFTAHFDAREHAQMEEYFATDGLWSRRDGDIRGIEQLRASMAKRASNSVVRHVITNMRTELLSPERAVVDSYVTVFRHVFAEGENPPAPMGPISVMGRYRDELVRQQSGEWMISERHSSIDFESRQP